MFSVQKSSRTEHFRKMFENYVSEYFYQSREICTNWELVLLTKNSRKNIHEYQLVIHAKYVAYVLEKQIVLNDGTKEGPGEMYLSQRIPNMAPFVQEASTYFAKFHHIKHNKCLAGVQIGDVFIHPENGDHMIPITIIYHKNQDPYPGIPLTQKQELDIVLDENKQLEKRLKQTENELSHAKDIMLSVIAKEEQLMKMFEHRMMENSRELDLMHNKNKKQQIKLSKWERAFQKMSKEMYATREHENCPVCYDEITGENLYANVCGHNICIECNSKCTKCPLCREEY